MLHDIAENLQAVNQHPMPAEHSFAIAPFCAFKHFYTPVNACLNFSAGFDRTGLQVGSHIRLQLFAKPIAIHNDAPIINLDKIVTSIFALKILGVIYKYIQ